MYSKINLDNEEGIDLTTLTPEQSIEFIEEFGTQATVIDIESEFVGIDVSIGEEDEGDENNELVGTLSMFPVSPGLKEDDEFVPTDTTIIQFRSLEDVDMLVDYLLVLREQMEEAGFEG